MIVFKKIKWKNFLSTGNQFLTIDLNKSASTLVIGENGSGKSTTIGMILGLIKPSSGAVIINGQNIEKYRNIL